jgi:hypothetical protein
MLIRDLFRVQSKPWESMAKNHLKDVWVRARKHVEDILSQLMDTEAYIALLIHWVNPLMKKQLTAANDKIDSLFRDRHRHAITYNYYFTDNVQKIFNTCYESQLAKVLEEMFPVDDYSSKRVGPKDLSRVCSMMSRTIPDMDTRASIDYSII